MNCQFSNQRPFQLLPSPVVTLTRHYFNNQLSPSPSVAALSPVHMPSLLLASPPTSHDHTTHTHTHAHPHTPTPLTHPTPNPPPPHSLLLYGMTCCLDEHYFEAEQFFEMATTSDPTNIIAWTMRGKYRGNPPICLSPTDPFTLVPSALPPLLHCRSVL